MTSPSTTSEEAHPRWSKKVKGNVGNTGNAGAAGKEGAPGKEGPQGKEGVEGKVGPRGPSDAYEAGGVENTEITSSPKTLTLKLPAGSYDITGLTQIQNGDSAHTAVVRCTLDNGASELTSAYIDAQVDIGGEYGDSDAVLHSRLTTSSEATVTFSCEKGGGESTSINANNPTLSAIKVETLH